MPTVLGSKFEDLVAIGLRVLISEDPNLELVAEDVAMESVEAAIERHRPDVALLNFGTLGSPGRVLQLHRAHPATRIVVLANRPTAAECNQMLSFGATACLSKETRRATSSTPSTSPRAACTCCRARRAAGGLLGAGVQGADLLTPREAEVLELLQDGATNAEIAHELSIGIETVRTHARHIYRKLGIASRRELTRLARQDPIVAGHG